ncbi:helicase associated domain-containing protein [Arthrobacter sp. TB 26]|uniref:helicase associated domain-containing protein n=1 Tax=Arthrobacter sp. TB 26 TaxID=494420 RepID=UPI001ED98689|nr:helicase associated domain-containing protein [Arthrobacter sp. TB 26]
MMTSIMDRRLRRAPDAEWVLMYRLGLSRKRIAELVRADPASVGYHLVIARRQDPGLEAAHLAAARTGTIPSPAALARMEQIIAWITAEHRFPRDRSEDKSERSMARWRSDRRREAADGTLSPAYRDGLASIPAWEGNPRAAADDARWHDRLAQLSNFRAEGNDWPRHRHCASDREHTLGVWIHAQRQKNRRSELEAEKVKLLDDAVPGWQTGRTRGRPARL